MLRNNTINVQLNLQNKFIINEQQLRANVCHKHAYTHSLGIRRAGEIYKSEKEKYHYKQRFVRKWKFEADENVGRPGGSGVTKLLIALLMSPTITVALSNCCSVLHLNIQIAETRVLR